MRNPCRISGGTAHQVGFGTFDFASRTFNVPDEDCVILMQQRCPLAPPRKRPRRIQNKIDKRNGRLRYKEILKLFHKIVLGRAGDLPPKTLREFNVLGEIRV